MDVGKETGKFLTRSRFSFACAKFSLRSDVDLHQSKLRRYLRLVGDHFSIANDLSSYAKEREAFESGASKHLINVIAVMKSTTGSADLEDAKKVCYGLQLQTEQAIVEELERMRQCDTLTAAEWRLVEALLFMTAGNVFTSLAIDRYGGENARIDVSSTSSAT